MPYYALDDIRLSFDIRDFIQVNTHLNQKMVETALDWLDLNQDDHVLDFILWHGKFHVDFRQTREKCGWN